ncbi:MAG: hypothetical protein F6J94_12845 [Moorea sp. SIO1F2]|uniref:hypothetical protein n=1 Tax=Moorena sp. SIO1F2 TaxID=2607819 RepID=UPI0013B60301|nr:hypothetical protein [Moorena sp. SIO1F2]NET82778.1 hypothetical protein [Moorena sp. SIO1F2]
MLSKSPYAKAIGLWPRYGMLCKSRYGMLCKSRYAIDLGQKATLREWSRYAMKLRFR